MRTIFLESYGYKVMAKGLGHSRVGPNYNGDKTNHVKVKNAKPYESKISDFDPGNRQYILYRLLWLKHKKRRFSKEMLDLINEPSLDWEEIMLQAVIDFGNDFCEFNWAAKSPLYAALNSPRGTHKSVAERPNFDILLQLLLKP